jgi:hypothetical protein
MGREGRAVPPTLSAVVSRFETRGLVQDERSFSEAGLIASMAVVNVARADPGGGGRPAFAPLTPANVHDKATPARVLSEAIYKREVSDIAAASSPSEAHRIAAGLSKCAASFLCAVPMVRPFTIVEGIFMRSL